MAKDFLPKVITWFRLDEHVRRLKEFVDSLTTRVETLEENSGNTPTLQQVTTEGNTTDKDIISEHASQVRVIEVRQTITNAAAGLYATGLLKLRNTLGWTANLSGGNLTADRTFEFPDETGTLVLDAPIDGNQYARQDGGWEEITASGASKEYYALVTVNSSGIPSLQQLRNTTGITFTVERNAAGSNRFTASSPVLTSANAGFTLQDADWNPSANTPYVRGAIQTSIFLDVNILPNIDSFGGVDTEHKYYIKIELMS